MDGSLSLLSSAAVWSPPVVKVVYFTLSINRESCSRAILYGVLRQLLSRGEALKAHCLISGQGI